MQLNNLVIIPVPSQGLNGLLFKEQQPLSPIKNLSKTMSQRDEIPWKKSQSAFKKFKGKKDKQSKSVKSSQTNLVLLEPNQQEQTLNKNFSLVDNDINFSLLNNQNDQNLKSQETFDYYDPNAAPFFEFGVSYQYMSKQGKVKVIQQQKDQLKLAKPSQSIKLKREPSKKQKSKEEIIQKSFLIKTQKKYNSQGLILNAAQYLDDPFIIIKAPERKGQSLQFIKSQYSKKEQYTKNKLIKKGFRPHSRTSSVRSFSNYSHQNSDEIKKQQSLQSEQKSDDYGCDQLPLIQFDLCKHINSGACNQQKAETGSYFPIYQIKEDSQILLKMKQLNNNGDMLKQYQFTPSQKTELKNQKQNNQDQLQVQNQE